MYGSESKGTRQDERQAVAGLFQDAVGAEQAIRALMRAGYPGGKIGVAIRDTDIQEDLARRTGTELIQQGPSRGGNPLGRLFGGGQTLGKDFSETLYNLGLPRTEAGYLANGLNAGHTLVLVQGREYEAGALAILRGLGGDTGTGRPFDVIAGPESGPAVAAGPVESVGRTASIAEPQARVVPVTPEVTRTTAGAPVAGELDPEQVRPGSGESTEMRFVAGQPVQTRRITSPASATAPAGLPGDSRVDVVGEWIRVQQGDVEVTLHRDVVVAGDEVELVMRVRRLR